jgi:hypothetical protein
MACYGIALLFFTLLHCDHRLLLEEFCDMLIFNFKRSTRKHTEMLLDALGVALQLAINEHQSKRGIENRK